MKGQTLILKDHNSGDYVEVTNENALKVCICENACKACITMESLMKMYPGLHISIHESQLKGGSNAKTHKIGTQKET